MAKRNPQVKRTPNGSTTAPKAAKRNVIASRKSCSATGTGLSHYILTNRDSK